MTFDRDLLERECQLRLVEHIRDNHPTSEPLDLWIDGFWACHAAIEQPRAMAEVQALLDMHRAVRARRLGENAHAHDRPRTRTDSPARRESDAIAAEITAYLAGAGRPERDSDGAGRPPTNDDASEVKP